MKHSKIQRLTSAFILICALFISACAAESPAPAPAEPTPFSRPVIETTLNPAYGHQNSPLAANDLLWQTFTLDEYGMPESYPEEYGGAYVVGSILYIYLTDMRDEVQEWYMEVCHHSTAVKFIEAEYSANYLQSLSSVVSEYTDKYSITSYGVDFRNNCFSVGVADKDDREALAAELDNPAIVIEPGAYAQLA